MIQIERIGARYMDGPKPLEPYVNQWLKENIKNTENLIRVTFHCDKDATGYPAPNDTEKRRFLSGWQPVNFNCSSLGMAVRAFSKYLEERVSDLLAVGDWYDELPVVSDIKNDIV